VFRVLFTGFAVFFKFKFLLVFCQGIGFVFGRDIVVAPALGTD